MSTDPDHFVALYDATVDDVYRYASRLTGGDRARADDLVQDTYLGVLRRIRSGESIDVTTGYLVVACRSRFLDDLKARRRRFDRERRVASRDTEIADPANRPVPTATEQLGRLPDDQRAALVLRYVDDLTVADVAELMDRSVSATESLLARGRRALRALLDEGEGHG